MSPGEQTELDSSELVCLCFGSCYTQGWPVGHLWGKGTPESSLVNVFVHFSWGLLLNMDHYQQIRSVDLFGGSNS